MSDWRNKNRDGWIARLNLILLRISERAHIKGGVWGSNKVSKSKDINELHIELMYPFEEIIQATGKTMGLKLTGAFKTFEDFALENAKKAGVSKLAVER